MSGTVAGLIGLAGRKHNSEDIRATVLAVEPPTFVHRLRIAIFSVSIAELGEPVNRGADCGGTVLLLYCYPKGKQAKQPVLL